MKIIPFRSEISVPAIENLVTELREDVLPWVYVDSPGGQFEFFSAIGPALQRRGIVTLGGNVASAAVILYLLGHQRYALPSTRFMFHEVRVFGGPLGTVTLSGVDAFEEYEKEMSDKGREAYQEWRRQMHTAQDWFADFVSNRVGINSGFFHGLMRKEATIDADEAKFYGLVHEILPENFLSQMYH